MNVKVIAILLAFCAVALGLKFGLSEKEKNLAAKKDPIKLYWFIPDGLRNDPNIFKMYEWARNGELPNLQKLLQEGSYGYSRCTFPSHTPTNFATLLTGTIPTEHGISDGPIRMEGYPLKMVVKGGFNSATKKVPPIWYTLEQQDAVTSMYSVPGSTPPETTDGVIFRGRWGGWGIDIPSVVFHHDDKDALKKEIGPRKRLFHFGAPLTNFFRPSNPKGWATQFKGDKEFSMEHFGLKLHALVGKEKVVFSYDKQKELLSLKEGQWSDWFDVTLKWELKNDYNVETPDTAKWERDLSNFTFDTKAKLKVIANEGNLTRLRLIFNGANPYVFKPLMMHPLFEDEVGPFLDYVDNYPAQLIYHPKDKDTFLEEMNLSFESHKKLIPFAFKYSKSDVIIQTTYSSNQLNTSRWWMGYVDPESPRYNDISEEEREEKWREVKSMYKHIDDMIGLIRERLPKDAYFILSSDHGALPIDQEVMLNNFFAKKGWLKYRFNKKKDEFEVDWKKTKVVFLKVDDVYINPKGLDGNFHRASGKEYIKLRDEVIKALQELKGPDGRPPVSKIVKWEEAAQLGLPGDRVGDLILANNVPYGWAEDITAQGEIFKKTTRTGYKQAALPELPGLHTPFVIAGPGIKKGHKLKETLFHTQQLPTVYKILGKKQPPWLERKAISEVFE